MSQYFILKEVNEMLKKFLLDNIPELIGEDSVVFDSPADITGQKSEKISMFLYQIVENVYFKNMERQPVHNDINLLQKPSLTVDLYYLFTPFAQTIERELFLLERLMAIFYDYPVLRTPIVPNSLISSGNEEMKIVSQNLSLEEITKLWERFPNKPYKLSLAYMLSPVQIPSMITDRINIVEERNIKVFNHKTTR